MGILTVRNKAATTPGKFIGVNLPQQISSYLSLYALFKEITKSVIIRDQMEEWYKAKRIINSEKELILTIANGIKNQWKIRKTGFTKMSITKFKAELKCELRQKGIDEDHIETIIIELGWK